MLAASRVGVYVDVVASVIMGNLRAHLRKRGAKDHLVENTEFIAKPAVSDGGVITSYSIHYTKLYESGPLKR